MRIARAESTDSALSFLCVVFSVWKTQASHIAFVQRWNRFSKPHCHSSGMLGRSLRNRRLAPCLLARKGLA